MPPGGYQPWGPGYSPYGVGPGMPYVAARPTNGLAIASLATSAGGIIFFGLPCVVGVVLGFVALSQIKNSGGAQQGRGLAIAGVIVGFTIIAMALLLIGVGVAASHNTQ